MRTLILCLGNEIVSDDGIGARAGRFLQSLPLPSDIRVVLVPRLGLDLLDQLAEVEHLVIVDGLTAEAHPGTCTVVDVTEHSPAVVASGCCHVREVRDIIQSARDLSPEGAACTITIAGVRVEHVQHVEHYGAEFSHAVLSAIPRLVDLLLLTTGAELKLRLLAAELLRPNPRPARAATMTVGWRTTGAQAVVLQ